MGKLHSMAAKGYDIPNWLAAEGMVFDGSDADQNDPVSGQTSFAATTPTLLIDVPNGTAVIPLEFSLYPITATETDILQVLVEKDNIDRYNTGGTAETIYNDMGKTGSAALYSGATANAGYGTMLFATEQILDTSELSTEFAKREILWTHGRTLDIIRGPGAFLVYAWTTTNANAHLWHIKWAEIPESWVT